MKRLAGQLDARFARHPSLNIVITVAIFLIVALMAVGAMRG